MLWGVIRNQRPKYIARSNQVVFKFNSLQSGALLGQFVRSTVILLIIYIYTGPRRADNNAP